MCAAAGAAHEVAAGRGAPVAVVPALCGVAPGGAHQARPEEGGWGEPGQDAARQFLHVPDRVVLVLVLQ